MGHAMAHLVRVRVSARVKVVVRVRVRVRLRVRVRVRVGTCDGAQHPLAPRHGTQGSLRPRW